MVWNEIDAVERYFMYIVCYLAFIYAMGDLQGYIDIYRKSHPPFR